MRIISGTFKSRKLIAPHGDSTRPTSDRARESVFNVLTNLVDLEGISVADLFAGTGAFAFEAISRGAKSAMLVEKNQKAIEAIRENMRALGISDCIQIVQKDVYQWLGMPTGTYDLIFADPPYDDDRTLGELPAAIIASGLLTTDSLVIVEHRTGSRVVLPANIELIRELRAGEAVFSFLRRKQDSKRGENSKSDLPGHL